MLRWTPDVSSTDEELVRACRAGNQAAWNVLIEKYKKLVYSIPSKFQLLPEDAADVFQSVWADLHRDIASLDQPNAVRGWLMTAATRRCLLFKKRRLKMLTQSGLDAQIADPAPDVVSIQLDAEREQKLREAVIQLPDRCQKMIHMLFYEPAPRPYVDVARELGLAEGSIGFIRGRCLKKLKAILDQMETP